MRVALISKYEVPALRWVSQCYPGEPRDCQKVLCRKLEVKEGHNNQCEYHGHKGEAKAAWISSRR